MKKKVDILKPFNLFFRLMSLNWDSRQGRLRTTSILVRAFWNFKRTVSYSKAALIRSIFQIIWKDDCCTFSYCQKLYNPTDLHSILHFRLDLPFRKSQMLRDTISQVYRGCTQGNRYWQCPKWPCHEIIL